VWRDRASKSLTVTPEAGGSKEKVASNDAAGGKGRLGVAVRPLSPEERRDGEVKNGVVVERVSGAAARAGLQEGDILLSLNGKPITGPEDLRNRIEKSGRNAALLVQRDERRLFVPVELG
jgi:serine protease Do